MAGFVLVPLAAVLVLSMFLVIERGRVPQSLPVDRTGTFWLLPLEDAEDPAEMDPHPEVPQWAWVDLPEGHYDLPLRRRYQPRQVSAAQSWALSLDDGIARGWQDALEQDAAERHEALMAAYAATTAAFKTHAADDVIDEALAAVEAAKAGSEHARRQWHAVIYA